MVLGLRSDVVHISLTVVFYSMLFHDSENAIHVARTGARAGDESGMTHTRKRFIQQEHHHNMARLKLQLLVALKDSGFVDFKLADT